MVRTSQVVWLGGQRYSHNVGLPLVSLVVINRNYAGYIPATIESIKGQDYPSLEVVIVDNDSTDKSRDVIVKHVEADDRFRIVALEQNLGQLGAFFDIFPLLNGELIAIIDADDVIFSDYVSSHVQVHVALPTSVAFTSSNVVEITKAGRAMTGSYSSFNSANPATRGLRDAEKALRLPTISDDDYLRLSRATSTHVSESGWIWGPGTSNMYRRSVLVLVHQRPSGRVYIRAADSYLNRFCQVLGGSALIDRQLSAYRIHAANSFTVRESIGRLSKGKSRSENLRRQKEECLEDLQFLLGEAARFSQVLPHGRFWRAFERMSHVLRDKRRKLLQDPESIQLFADNYDALKRVFGEVILVANLRRNLRLKDQYAVIRGANDGRIPLHLRLSLVRQGTRELWLRGKKCAKSSLKKVRRIVARKNLPATAKHKRKERRLGQRNSPPRIVNRAKQKDPQPDTQRAPANFGPATLISSEPPIIMTGALLGVPPLSLLDDRASST